MRTGGTTLDSARMSSFSLAKFGALGTVIFLLHRFPSGQTLPVPEPM